MKIGRKVTLLTSGLIAVQLTSFAVSTAVLVQANEADQRLVQELSANSDASATLARDFTAQSRAWSQMLLNNGDAEKVAYHHEQVKKHAAAVDAAVKQLNEQVQDPAIRAAVAEFEFQHRYATDGMAYAAPLLATGEYNVRNTNVQALETRTSDLAGKPAQLASQAADQDLTQVRDLERTELITLLLANLALLAGALVVARVMTRRIVRPIEDITQRAVGNASTALPSAVDRISNMTGDVSAPEVPTFSSPTKDELVDLAGALNTLQGRSLDLAVMQRRTELNSAETLVNLGRRNQSLLTRTLSYLGELEREERDENTLGKLYRLDHVVTRLRRNMESLLVLAGVEQTRTHSRPLAVDSVLRAALSEIEDYTRVSMEKIEPVGILGSATADLAHLLAELIENGTQFSPGDKKVRLFGRATDEGYLLSVIDEGLGMSAEELRAANAKLSEASRTLDDSKILGLHIVARIAARHGVTVTLVPTAGTGTTAQVLLPSALLVEAPTRPSAAGAAPRQAATKAPAADPAPAAATQSVAVTEPTPAAAQPVQPAEPAQPAAPAAEPAPAQPAPVAAAPVPEVEAAPPAAAPAAPVASVPTQAATGRPTRRVRGAQLPDLGQAAAAETTQADPELARRQFSGLQASVARARQQSKSTATDADNGEN